MVDAQTIGVLVTAASVTVAAVYYMINLRETTRNRRVALTTSLMQNFTSEEGSRRQLELMQMKWRDFDDFRAKYDSSVNPDNYAKRVFVMNTCDMLGYQYLSGQLDLCTLWSVCNNSISACWEKFGPIILEYKKRGDYNQHIWENFEYLAYEMSRAISEVDSGYKMPPVYRSDEYYRGYRRGRHPF